MTPPFLKKNDKVALVAPARKITFEEIEYSVSLLRGWGLDVVLDEGLFKSYHQFAGVDSERLLLIQSMLDDPSIKALFCVRGGYGSTRIIDKINFSSFINRPKWICGYSDITALLCHVYNFDIESIHSTMPLLFQRDSIESLESLKKLLFGEEDYLIKVPNHALNKKGKATGKIVGGNLSILNHLISTPSDINTDGVLLFLEDIDEYLYNIDRMMVHLKRAGKLERLAGLIVGHMTDMKDNPIPFGLSAYEIIHSHVKDFSFPVCFGVPVGHESSNYAIPVGRVSKLEVSDLKTEILF